MPEINDIPGGANAEDAASFEDMFGEDAFNSIGDQPAEDTSLSTSDAPGSSAGDDDTSRQENQTAADNGGDSPDPDSSQASDDGSQTDDQTPKGDPDRVEYWQSRADKAMAEVNKLKSQYEKQNPIFQYINENPEIAQKVYGTIREHMSNDSQGSSATTGSQSVSVPERPTKPEKPSNYDPMDAVSNPESESFKYRAKMEEYNENLVEYNESIVQSQDAKREQENQQQAQQQQIREKAKGLYEEAVYRYGMDQNAAAQFVRWSMNPDYSVGDLIAVYNAQQRETGKKQQKANQMNQKNKDVDSPPPPAQNGNNVSTKKSEVNIDDPKEMGDAFTDSLFGAVGM